MGWIAAAAAFSWGLLRFGATETATPYRVFLVLAAAALLILATTKLSGPRLALTGAVGITLLVWFLLAGPVQGRGLLIALLGLLSLFLVLAWGTRGLAPVTTFLLAVGGIEAVLGLTQALGGVDYIGTYFRDVGAQATGTLINHNHFAGLMNMLVALAAGLAYAGYRRRAGSGQRASERLGWAWLVLLLTAFMGLAVLLSLSRAGSIVLGVTLLAMAAAAVARSLTRRSLQAAAFALVLLLLISVLTVATGPAALAARFSTLDSDWQLRSTLYRDSLAVIAESPWTGVGPGLFAWRLRPHQTLDARIWWRNAHNDYLQSAAEWGIPLAAGFWLFFLWRFLQGLRAFWRASDPWLEGIALGTSGALLSILLHSLVDFNLQIPTTLMALAAIVGLSWVCSETVCRLAAQENGA